MPSGSGGHVISQTLTVNDYTGNALADEMTSQLGPNFEVVYCADTLQMEMTTKNKDLSQLSTDRELFEGVITVTPYDKNNPKSFNTVISNCEQNKADTFISGIVDLRGFLSMHVNK